MRHGIYSAMWLLVISFALPASRCAAYAPRGLAADDDDAHDPPKVIVATGDFNRDGVADMVEAISPDGKGSAQRSLIVLLGRPDGTFQGVASQNLAGADPRAIVVADFNGDGDPDVMVGDADGALLEFLGDGKGGLKAAGKVANAGSVVSLAIGHFTRDGKVDIVVSDVRSNSAEILLGGGDGSFRLAWSFQLPRRGIEYRIATADFNKDGITDLAITSEDDENYEVMLGTGNGTFTYSPELSHLKDPNSYCPT